jgi:hypothetical protein
VDLDQAALPLILKSHADELLLCEFSRFEGHLLQFPSMPIENANDCARVNRDAAF